MKVTQKLFLFFSVMFAFAITGCMPASGVRIETASVDQIVKGKTTKQEVVAMWGQPMMKTFAGDGERWTYVHQGMLHALSVFSGPEMQSLSILFSGNTVKDFVFNTDGAGDASVFVPPGDVPAKVTPPPVQKKVSKKK